MEAGILDTFEQAFDSLKDQHPNVSLKFGRSPINRTKPSAAVDIKTSSAVAQVCVWSSGECETYLAFGERAPEIRTHTVKSFKEIRSIIQSIISRAETGE
jgi:hypothetical protein